MKDLQYFQYKESLLNIALDKIKAKLQYFNDNKDNQEFKEWNNWHDLQYRIEQRLWANWSEYKDWHWKTFDFNSY